MWARTRAQLVTCQSLTLQVLHSSCPDIVTLDLGKIAGRGITMGSDFKVPALADADRCFGPNSAVRPHSPLHHPQIGALLRCAVGTHVFTALPRWTPSQAYCARIGLIRNGPATCILLEMQADAAGDAGAQIAAMERLQTALLARDELAQRVTGLEQVRDGSVRHNATLLYKCLSQQCTFVLSEPHARQISCGLESGASSANLKPRSAGASHPSVVTVAANRQ